MEENSNQSNLPDNLVVLFIALGFAAGFYNTELCLQVKALLDSGVFDADKLASFVRRLGARVVNLAWSEFESARASGVSVLVPLSREYPRELWEISDPPLALFVRGNLRRRFSVAVVGSRRATEQAIDSAFLIGRTIAERGGSVISGLAYGVDKSAHEGALRGACEGVCPGVCVLGSGVRSVYPGEHVWLAEELIARGGAVVSEYGVTLEPKVHYFPRRNRIISGLSRSVVVVQASDKSGSLITARLALEQGRDVYAVPGSFSHKGCAGSNGLIKSGAQVVCLPEDVLENIPDSLKLEKSKVVAKDSQLKCKPASESSYRDFFDNSELAEVEKVINILETADAVDFDTLQTRTRIEPVRLSKILGMLELGETVKVRNSGQYQLAIDS